MNHFRLKYFASLVGAALCLMAGSASAQSVDSVMDADGERIQQAVESQERVDAIGSETDQLVADYRLVLKDIEGRRVYNRQLELLIADQVVVLADLAQSIDRATSMEVDLVPLQLQMLDALSQYIELDLPFLLDERRARIERLENNMSRSDLSVAEKFRQVLEAYEIEAGYSQAIDDYSDIININGQELEVDILRVGRIALMYQTKDQASTGAWNTATGAWEELSSGDYKSAVQLGLRISKQQAAMEILNVPVAAPQG